MQAGWCLICGSARREEFASKAADRVSNRLAEESRGKVHFVICSDCGHVYQHPMLDAGDLERIYTDEYRPFTEASAVHDLFRGRTICETFAPLVESSVRGRTVLDIGFGQGGFLRAFHERGWEVFGIDPVPTWADFVRKCVGGTERTIVNGHYGPETFPGQRFSLILFSHTVEHLPDPAPMLRTMRRHLAEDGALFVAAPNLLNPPPVDMMFNGFLAGAHVRLYSRHALKTVLARSGFRADTDLEFQGSFGMGLVARPADGVPDCSFDDATAIRRLYIALAHPQEGGALGRNLAALLKTQWWVLPSLCQQVDTGRYRVERNGGAVSIIGLAANGEEVPIVRRGERQDCQPSVDERLWAKEETLVQLGLGSGELARTLAARLKEGQHLFIWEADPSLAKLILKLEDLSPLWDSSRVTLILGNHPILPADRKACLMRPCALYLSESAQRWNEPVYRTIIATLRAREAVPGGLGKGQERRTELPATARA
ncbi:MAG: class I SAM-dependent methyltransferase [Nitrospirae bacterium]|nr:class I SAM-dependent methyltransferase [Nitrospirota bacterium]